MRESEPEKGRRKGLPTFVKYLIGLGAIVLLFLAGYIPKLRNSNSLNAAAKQTAATVPEVEVATPRYEALANITLPGTVDAIAETSVQARTTGYVTKLYVDIGSHVKAGQILADIKAPDVGQQFLQASAETNQSRAVVNQSQATAQSLDADVLAAQANVTHQRAALVQADAALDGAKAAKAQAEANLQVAKSGVNQSAQQVLVQKAAVTQSQANYNLGSANLKRETELLREGFVAQQDYDTAAATFKNDTATIGSAQAGYEAAVANEQSAKDTVKANEQAVQSAQAAEDEAAANVKAARASLDSSIATLNASRASFTAGKETVQANVAAVGSSVANERRYGVLLSFTHVVAPFDGIITARNVDVGSLVSPGAISSADATSTTPTAGLFGMARIDTLRIYVSLPQSDYQWAPKGTAVDVLIQELPTHHFTGIVHQTAGALDSTTRTLLTEVRIPNADGVLLPGMYAQVEFSSGAAKELRIPDGTIVIDGQGTRVLVVDSTNHLHYQKVVLGKDYGTESQVLSGVKPTDPLVQNATDNFLEGEVVQIAPQATKT